MRKIHLLGTIALAGLMVLGSCKKEETNNGSGTADVTGKNAQEIFMMQNWRWDNELDSAENGTEWTSNMIDCNKDDVYTFKTGGVVTINEGAKDCDPGLDQVYNSTWSMQKPTSTKVKIHGIQWDIISQTNTDMILERVFNPGSEDHYLRQYWKRN